MDGFMQGNLLQLTKGNPDKLALEGDELLFKPAARSNNGLTGPIVMIVVTLIIFPVDCTSSTNILW